MHRADDSALEGRSGPPRGARSAGTLVLALTFVGPAALLWSWSRPQPVEPVEMPALSLPPTPVRVQIEADRAAAERAPNDALARARREVYTDANKAELEARDTPARAMQRRRRLEETLRAVVAAHGEDALAAVRAADLDRAERVMRAELPEVRWAGELGGFVEMMRRWGMVERDRQVAPRFVVRTAFKARWNAMFGREPTEGMSRIEERAHWGWLALRAERAPFEARLDALSRYRAAGGDRTDEARAVLLYQADRIDEARRAFEVAYAARPTFRLRNHALAAARR